MVGLREKDKADRKLVSGKPRGGSTIPNRASFSIVTVISAKYSQAASDWDRGMRNDAPPA